MQRVYLLTALEMQFHLLKTEKLKETIHGNSIQVPQTIYKCSYYFYLKIAKISLSLNARVVSFIKMLIIL